MAGSILGFSLPTFWVGLMLIMVFAVQLGWLPSHRARRDGDAPRHAAGRFLTARRPARTCCCRRSTSRCSRSALVIRLTRAGVRETLPMDYVKFARAKGLVAGARHRRARAQEHPDPVVTVLGLEFGSTIAFAVVTETIFAWPGMGKLIIDSINVLDRPVIVAYLMIIVLHVHRHQPGGRPRSTPCSIRASGSEAQGDEHDRPPRARPPSAGAARSRRRSGASSRSSPTAGSRWSASCVFVLIVLRRALRALDLAAEPLRPRAARHHGRAPAAGQRRRGRLHLSGSAPTTRAATCCRRSSTACASADRRRRLGADRLRGRHRRSGCSRPMPAAGSTR